MPSAWVRRLVQERMALRAVIRGRKRLQHDFRRSGSCSVPLTLALRNCSDSPISVCVEAGPPSGVQPAGTVWRAEVVMPLLQGWVPIYTLTHICTLAQVCEMVIWGLSNNPIEAATIAMGALLSVP